MLSHHDQQKLTGRTQGNKSILVGGIHEKYDLRQSITGEAIGGPDKKPKISMWDLMTLYDVKKKRIEDQAAFAEQKKQQKDLREFYDT